VGRVAGNPGYDTASARDRDQVYNARSNGFVVFHGDMGTLSRSASAAQKNAAVLGAQMRTVEAIAQRQNQATNEVFSEPASGASSLSEQRAALLHAGPAGVCKQRRGGRRPAASGRRAILSGGCETGHVVLTGSHGDVMTVCDPDAAPQSGT
jgi:hypothetical protein